MASLILGHSSFIFRTFSVLKLLTLKITGQSVRTRQLLSRTEELEAALDSIKVLKGLVPICAHCKKIRDDHGFWLQVENYISEYTDVEFSHGICPDCLRDHYPGFKHADSRDGER